MKGQIALEFIIMVTAATIAGMLILSASSAIFTHRSEEQRIAALNDIGYMIQDEAILATTVTGGYRREIAIPEKADRFTYTISSENTSVTLRSAGTVITYPIPAVDGAFRKGTNIITQNGSVAVQ